MDEDAPRMLYSCAKEGETMVDNESINKRRRDKKQNGREQRSEAEEGVFFRKN